MDAAVEAREYNRELSKEDEVKALELLKQQGMSVTVLSDGQKEEFKGAMNEIYTDVKAEIGDELFNKLMVEINDK